MSQQYDVQIQREGELELERQRLERERQKRIQDEREKLQQLQSQAQQAIEGLRQQERKREENLTQLRIIIQNEGQNEQFDLEARYRQEQLMLEQQIQQINHAQDSLHQQVHQTNTLLQSLDRMSPEDYLVFNTLEHVLQDWGNMSMHHIENLADGTLLVRFAHDQFAQLVSMNLNLKDEKLLSLDVTEGFEGTECDSFMEQVTEGVRQQGYNMSYQGRGWNRQPPIASKANTPDQKRVQRRLRE
ncbi:MAG: hypothetical protein HY862_13855 [Chloroflexi bacterium]|nr:hypothetical protein [Chloroflexota bacterium]